MFEELKDYNTLDWAKLLFIIGLVILIGLFAVNQFAEFRYKNIFLTTPCDLCLELNPDLELNYKINLPSTNQLNNITLPVIP